MKELKIILIVLIVSNCNLYSQYKTIKGRVISNQFDTMIGVSIMINDTVKVGETDRDGFFQIEISDSVKKILFRDIGMELASIGLIDTCDEVEVVMMFRGTYDFRTPKQVNRLRKKEFKKLPELHKEAFSKGLFKTDKACYSQEFIHSYQKKQ